MVIFDPATKVKTFGSVPFTYDFQTNDSSTIDDCKNTLDKNINWTTDKRHNILPALEIMEKTRIKSTATSGDMVLKLPNPSMIPDMPFHTSINRNPTTTTIETYYYIWVNLKNDLNSHPQRMNAIICSNDANGKCFKYPVDYTFAGIVQSRELYNTNSFFQIRIKFTYPGVNDIHLHLESKQTAQVRVKIL